MNAVHRKRFRGIDGFDPRMPVRASEHRRIERARQMDIIRKAPFAAEQNRVFNTLYGGTEGGH